MLPSANVTISPNGRNASQPARHIKETYEPHWRILRKPHLLLDRQLPRSLQQPEGGPELRGLRAQLPGSGGDLLRRLLHDLATDALNCGRCGTACAAAPPYAYAACVSGTCVYDCVDGADDCGDGTCTPLSVGSRQLRHLRTRLARTNSVLQRGEM